MNNNVVDGIINEINLFRKHFFSDGYIKHFRSNIYTSRCLLEFMGIHAAMDLFMTLHSTPEKNTWERRTKDI